MVKKKSVSFSGVKTVGGAWRLEFQQKYLLLEIPRAVGIPGAF
jgi:hypothetical protein